MPIYEYRRDDGTTFEHRASMESDPLHVCPETGQNCVRLISGGHGALLPAPKTVKYRDGRFINRKMAKTLEKNPLATTISDKAKKIQEKSDKARQHNAEMRRKVTGRISEI